MKIRWRKIERKWQESRKNKRRSDCGIRERKWGQRRIRRRRNKGRWYVNVGGERKKGNGRWVRKMKRKRAWGIRERKWRQKGQQEGETNEDECGDYLTDYKTKKESKEENDKKNLRNKRKKIFFYVFLRFINLSEFTLC